METPKNKYKTGQIRTDNREKIIAITEMEFAEFGYKGASIMNIAKRAKMPRANVHYYSQSKLELYKKVLTDILQLWNEAFNQITPEDDPAHALMGGFASSKILEVHGQRMLDRTFDPGFRIRLHQKDLNLALSSARAIQMTLPKTANT